MPSTFFGISIGQSGLTANQIGQDVTGHNISNASTPGYSVQSVDFEAGLPAEAASQASGSIIGVLGSGVVAGSVTRARDQFLDSQVRDGLSQQGNLAAQQDALQKIEDAFGEPSDNGLNTSLGKLFQNFNALVNNPEDLGVRSTVVQSGDALARTFQDVQSRLTSIGQSLTQQQTADVGSLNSYGQQIASINATIRASGIQSNDLLDRRDQLLDKISGIANISINNNKDGTINVAVGTSDLVTGTDAHQLALTGTNSLTARGDISGGDLGGLAVSQTNLAAYQGSLDNLAASVISTVNSVHQSGAGLDGTTGLNFFNGTNAATIAVNQTLVADPSKLAAAAVPSGGGTPPAGDASNATLLGALQNVPVTSGPLSGSTLQQFYQQSISNLGGQSASATTTLDSATANLTQLTQQRDSVTGVSTDDEMINMMKYQRGYEASAKVVATMNDMLGTLINNLFSNG